MMQTLALMEGMFDLSVADELLQPQAAVYLLLAILLFYFGKKIHDVMTPYDLDQELTQQDNKAVALSFGGYLFGLGLILWGIFIDESFFAQSDNPKKDFYLDLASTALWGTVGIFLLQLARLCNDKILLFNFDNTKELTKDKNVGTGAVECGSFIGSALIVKSSVIGESQGWLDSLTSILIFFVCGQFCFILFGFLYQKITSFDLHDEIEKDNVSAGIGFGLSLIAVGLILSSYILKYDSLPGLGLWFVIGAFLLVTCRFLVDKLVLPGASLDEEISKDKNWGAALVEGGSAIALALLLGSVF